MEALALRNQGDLLAETGDADRARALLEDALALARALGDGRAEALTLGSLGAVSIDRGDFGAARTQLEQSVALARILGDRRFEGVVTPYLGLAEVFAGDLDRGAATLDRGVALALRTGMPVTLVGTRAFRAATHAIAGRAESAADDLALARAGLEGLRHDGMATLVDAVVPAVLAARSRALAASGDAVGAKHAWEEALARVTDGGRPARTSYDIRFAVRLQERALALPTAPVASAPAPAPIGAAVIASDGDWFEVEGARVELASRAALRRLLAALVRSHLAGPGSPLDVAALFAAGWPGERAVATAARNRVYSAVYQLRKLGLDEVIQRRDDGWCLDPVRPVRIVDPALRS